MTEKKTCMNVINLEPKKIKIETKSVCLAKIKKFTIQLIFITMHEPTALFNTIYESISTNF